MKSVSISNAEHYKWGDDCDGWHLLKRDDISVIQEMVPPGKTEVMHYHEFARQFFYVLEGIGEIRFENEVLSLKQGEGVEISPKTKHCFENTSNEHVKFLVISVPKSHGDRINVEES